MNRSGLCYLHNICINYKKDIDNDKDRNCNDGWKFCKNIDTYDAGYVLKCKNYCKGCKDDAIDIIDGIQCLYNKKELQDKQDEFVCAIIDHNIDGNIRYIMTNNDYDLHYFNKQIKPEYSEFLSVDCNYHTYFSTLQREFASKFKLEDIEVIKDMIKTEGERLILYIININIIDIINDKFIIKSDGFYHCNEKFDKQLYLTDIATKDQIIKDSYLFGRNYYYTSKFQKSLKMDISMALGLLHKIQNSNISWRLSKCGNIIEQCFYYS